MTQARRIFEKRQHCFQEVQTTSMIFANKLFEQIILKMVINLARKIAEELIMLSIKNTINQLLNHFNHQFGFMININFLLIRLKSRNTNKTLLNLNLFPNDTSQNFMIPQHQIYQQRMINSFIFIRHAQSLHNQMTRTLAQRYPPQKLKSSQQYISKKFSRELLDASISKKGQQQCINARDHILLSDIDVVITSPLRRAIQTTMLIFGDRKNVKIIVQPLLTERITSACDIGASIKEMITEFKDRIDFSRVHERPQEWQLQYIIQEQKVLYLRKMLTKQHSDEEIHQAVLNLLVGQFQRGNEQQKNKTGYQKHPEEDEKLEQNGLQSKKDLQERIVSLKRILLELSKKYGKQKIAIVSHGNNLKMLTATGHFEDGQPINSISFSNCEIKKVPILFDLPKSNGIVNFCSCT